MRLSTLSQRILIILLAAALLFAVRACTNAKQEVRHALSGVDRVDSVSKVYRDELGRQHNELQERDFTLAELKYSHDKELVDLREEFGRKIKDLQSRTTVVVRTTDTVEVLVRDTVVLGDTARVFNYKDQWAVINGTIFRGGALLDYSFDTGVQLDRKWVRPHWYARKELVLDITMLNPRATLAGVTTYTLREDPPKWYATRGFQMGASFFFGYLIAPK